MIPLRRMIQRSTDTIHEVKPCDTHTHKQARIKQGPVRAPLPVRVWKCVLEEALQSSERELCVCVCVCACTHPVRIWPLAGPL